MNKKVIIILAVCVIIIGGALGFWLKTKGSSKETSKAETTHSSSNTWNPYATEEHHQVTLSDQLLSANKGEHVVKMNITIDFASDEAYYKFKGYKTEKEAKKAEKGSEHGSSSDKTATPMELKINDVIGQLMMAANNEQLTDREILKTYLKDGINRKLDFDKEIIKELYIENLVLQ